jgi:hypothetical protein
MYDVLNVSSDSVTACVRGRSRTADRCATCQRYVCVGCAPPLLRAAVADESRAARVSLLLYNKLYSPRRVSLSNNAPISRKQTLETTT